MNVQHLKDMNESREALKSIFSSIRYLATQGLTIRGKTEESSNLRTLLIERSMDLPPLKKWLDRPEKFKWLSPEISNEILQVFSLAIQRHLVEEVKRMKHYGLMLDESADILAKEQVSICLRSVDDDNFIVYETFFGFYETSRTTAKDLFDIVLDVMARFDLTMVDCRGQCYDGAAAMSGEITGLQTRIRNLEPRALFVHCRAHTLNLMVQDEIGRNLEIAKIMSTVQKFIAFARGSPKRLAWLKHFQEESDSENGTSLRPFCPTRWIMRKITLISITSNYATLLDWLRELEDNPDFVQCRAEASGFLVQFETFDAYFKLEMLRQVFTVLEDASTRLQGSQLNFRLAESLVETLKEVFKSARSSERFGTFWKAALDSAKAIDLPEPTLPRQRRVPTRLNSGNSAHHFPTTPEDEYQQLYFDLYNEVIMGLTSRFEPSETTAHLKKVENFLIGGNDSSDSIDLDYLKSFYKEDFDDYRRLLIQRDMVVDEAKRKNVKLVDFQSLLDFLKGADQIGLKNLVLEIVKLVKIILTMAISTCTAERSYSGLRRLKTYLRSTMSQERLNAVALINAHRDVLRNMNLDPMMDDFIRRCPVRTNTFSLSDSHKTRRPIPRQTDKEVSK